MKVADIDKKFQESMKDYQTLIEKQNAAKRQAEDLQSAAEDAALAGDVETYKDLKRKAEDAESLSYVLQKRIEKTGAKDVFTMEEVVDAWEEYADDHNKKLKAKLKKFSETKLDLLRQYDDLVTLQREACAVRERLARYIGVDKAPGTPDLGLSKLFPMDYIPCRKKGDFGALAFASVYGVGIADPDAIYFLANMDKRPESLAKDADVQTVVGVVGMHRTN